MGLEYKVERGKDDCTVAEATSHGALWSVLRNLAFSLSEIKCFCMALGKGVQDLAKVFL